MLDLAGSFSHAFSIALIIILLFLIFYKCDRRTFAAHPLAVHYVKGFAFGALHFSHPSVSRFTSSKALALVLCTSATHPFHGSLRQRLCLWCFALHYVHIACFLNDIPGL
jgi:hypothetical protein